MRDDLIGEVESLRVGDVTDLTTFMGAVIDDRSFARLSGVIDRVKGENGVDILAGGKVDDSEGYFVRPTIVQADNPDHEVFTKEYFGPILGVLVYDDEDFSDVMHRSAAAGPYGLTGSIIAADRAAIADATDALRFAAGNFYINDKPIWGRGRSAAVRRRPRQRHQRQGRVDPEPAALGVAADDQGDLRAGHPESLPVHGWVTRARSVNPATAYDE